MFINIREDFIDSFIIEYVGIKYLPYPIEIRRIQESRARDGMPPPQFIASRVDVVATMLSGLFPYLQYEDYNVFYVRHESLDKYFVLKDGFLELIDNTEKHRYYYGGTKYGL